MVCTSRRVMRFWSHFGLLLTCFFTLSVGAEVHRGYVVSVEEERKQTFKPLIVRERPEKPTQWTELIFTKKLKNEFKRRYSEKFGQTNLEQLISQPNRFTYYGKNLNSEDQRLTPGTFRGDEVQRQKENRRFGNFMFRRLIEYHLEDYGRNQEVVQKVVRAKENLSKVRLQFSKKYKLKARYRISGNFLRLSFVNPYIKNRVLVDFNDRDFGPSGTETTVSLFFPKISGVRMETHYKVLEQSFTLVGKRRLTRTMSASVTGKVNAGFLDGLDFRRQELILAGLSWRY